MESQKQSERTAVGIGVNQDWTVSVIKAHGPLSKSSPPKEVKQALIDFLTVTKAAIEALQNFAVNETEEAHGKVLKYCSAFCKMKKIVEDRHNLFICWVAKQHQRTTKLMCALESFGETISDDPGSLRAKTLEGHLVKYVKGGKGFQWII